MRSVPSDGSATMRPMTQTSSSLGLLARLGILSVCIPYSASSWAQNCPYDPRCLNNPYGAGNPFKGDGLMNPSSEYGSPYSDKSWTNPHATDAPKLYDQDGNYRGRLSSNPHDPDSTSNPFGRYGSRTSPDSINNPFGAGNRANTIFVQPQSGALNAPSTTVAPPMDAEAPAPYISPRQAGVAVLALIGIVVIGTVIKGIVDAVKARRASSAKTTERSTPSTPEELRMAGQSYLYAPQSRQDFADAKQILLKAANLGDSQAQFDLGVMYRNGRGVPVDEAEAFTWFKKSADNGNSAAQAVTGDYYAVGKVVARDYSLAYKYYRMSAEQGNVHAQAMTGAYLKAGIGVIQDLSESRKWLDMAANSDEPWGKYYLAEWLLYHDQSSGADGKVEAARLFRSAMESKIVLARYMLGSMYENGIGMPRDLDMAFNLYRDAAAANEKSAAFRLAYFYETGQATPKDINEAVRWYQKAEELGVVGARMKAKMLERLL